MENQVQGEICFVNDLIIPHAPTLPENAVYNEWQFQALVSKKGI